MQAIRWKGAKTRRAWVWRKYRDKVPELTLVACFGLFFNFFFNFVSILFSFVFIFTSPLFSLETLSPFSPFSSQKCLNTNQARFILLLETIANAISRFFLFYLSWILLFFAFSFQMRPRISIRGSVRPSVHPLTIRKNLRKRRLKPT